MKRFPRLALVVGFVWILAGIPSDAPAQEGETLGGFNLSTWGSGVTFMYNDPNSPIPARPTGEMHGAYSAARLASGPSGYGVASSLWPGETAATVAPFIESSFWGPFETEWRNNAGQDPPITNPRVAPRWPLAAESFEPQGPHEAEVSPNAHSQASANLVSAKANSVPLMLPGVFEVQGAASSARDAVEGTQALSKVTSTATGIRLLNGLIKIEKVATTAEVMSDGEKAVIEGQTVVTGLEINGQGFTIDDEGIHANGESQENPIIGQFNENVGSVLAENGVEMILARPIDTVSGSEGSRSVGGLIVRMDSRRFDEFVNQLPQEMQDTLRGDLGLSSDHTITFVLGAANASATAAPAFDASEFDFSEFGTDSDFGGATGGTGELSSGETQTFDSGTTGAVGSSAPVQGSAGDDVAQAPAEAFTETTGFAAPIDVEGVGGGMAILGMAAVVGLATLMRNVADVLAAGGGG